MEEKDVIIIGGGPAGITFASKLKKLAPERQCTMFRPEAHSMVYCAIPYAIEGLFDPTKVFKRDELVTGIGVELLKRSVKVVDFDKRQVTDETGTTYTYKTLFIATGASPIRPPIPGAESANVFTVKTGQDMTGIIDKVNAGAKRAVVVGAGAIGIEQAQAYQARGIETWLVDMAPYALPNMIDPEMSEPLNEALREKGVHLHFGAKVESLDMTDVGVRQVHLSTGEAIDLDPEKDFLCFAVGMKPDVNLFRGSALEMLKGLSKLSYSAQPWQSFFPARSAIVEACENALDAFAAKEPFHYSDLMECV